jgi:hypothetical protein
MKIFHSPARDLVGYLISSILLAVSIVTGPMLISDYFNRGMRPIAIAGASEVAAPGSTLVAINEKVLFSDQ